MNLRLTFALGAVLFAGLVGFESLPVQAEPNRVTFPNLEALEHYTTVSVVK